ncbi:hypothetical protein HPB51_007062 [Rhipicephalus microplus]|uniref:THAP-type domain-containing protein n=1 Tax=Rhipicephalus microplus TaxID=6941 RepID=A0A9J6E0I0_RHIMP|nr:hypothetical protein HPB51_007062 [Rhipicephalus microplus]
MPFCYAYQCNSRSEKGFLLFNIPWGKRDVQRKKQWLHNIGRKDFAPTRRTFLCEVHCLLHDDDDNTLSYDIAVSSPPLDAGSSPVVLPGSPVSPASSPSPPASVDEAGAVLDGPDEIQQQPESDNATLRMPLDHTRLLEDQARLLHSLLWDPPSDESWAQCEEAWTRAVALAVEAVRLLPGYLGRPIGLDRPLCKTHTLTTVYAFANYVGRVAVIPKKTAAKLSSIVNAILWEGKPAPVSGRFAHIPGSAFHGTTFVDFGAVFRHVRTCKAYVERAEAAKGTTFLPIIVGVVAEALLGQPA